MRSAFLCWLSLFGVGCVPDIHFDQSDATLDSGRVEEDVAGSVQFDGRQDIADDQSDAIHLDGSDSDAGTKDVAGPFDAMIDRDEASDRMMVSNDALRLDGTSDSAAVDRQCGSCLIANAAATCVDGTCRIDHCVTGFDDCNGDASDGCESSLETIDHCGSCATSCGSADLCSSHRCVSQRSCPDDSERGCGLVSVAGAAFQMGSAEASSGAPLAGRVTVSSFLVDSHEVTVARFRRFWNADRSSLASSVRYPSGTTLTIGPVGEPLSIVSGVRCNWTSVPSVRELHPLNCVDWSTAQAFCVWDGGRLPTEAEYEFASRYRDIASSSLPRRYPWGDEDPVEMTAVYPRPTACERAQFQQCVGDDGAFTRRVGSFPGSAGVFDLAGNVSEWMADTPSLYGTAPCWGPEPVDIHDPLCSLSRDGRSVRGGGFQSNSAFVLLGAARADRAASPGEQEQGFRCVRSP